MHTPDFLATVPLFKSLDASELARFAELLREKSYPKGSVILFEDDPGDSLFVVKGGRVKVVLAAEDGREVILGILGVGEHFGELSLIDERPWSAHVIAMEDSALLVLRLDLHGAPPHPHCRPRRAPEARAAAGVIVNSMVTCITFAP